MGSAANSGARLGRYQIIKHLASGGMAEVLLARASGIEGFTRHVVIKKIRPNLTKDQTFVQMFLNEARLAAQLHHANIVQVHDIGQEGNEYFFAMEYVHGEDVRRLLTQLARRKERIPIEHAITIIGAAAVALHHAHEQRGPDRKPLGIVHRDVTPANILVGYDGNVKVVDFGIAKAVARTHEETQAGTLKGKASYMSPEQCTAGQIDRRSDVFALGIVLYEVVTTRRLFKGDNDFLTMSSIVSGKIPSPKAHRPDLPDELAAIIAKALSLKTADRYQTADEMREALEAYAVKAGLRTSTSGLAAYMKQKFGERPEPWLVEDDEVEMEVTVDFDGSASGIVAPPRESIDELSVPPSAMDAALGSPIMKARTKAITTQPPSSKALAAAVAAKKPVAEPAKPKAVTPIGVRAQSDGSSGVPLPGVSQVSESAATLVARDPAELADLSAPHVIDKPATLRPVTKSIPKLGVSPQATPLPAKTNDGAKTESVGERDKAPPFAAAASPKAMLTERIRRVSAMPESWPNGSSAVPVAKLSRVFGTRKRKVIAAIVAGGIAIAVIAVAATRSPSSAHVVPPAPAIAPEPVKAVSAPAPEPPEPDPIASPEPPVKKPAPNKRGTQKTAPKGSSKPKAAVQKTSGKKWDPNALFPQKK